MEYRTEGGNVYSVLLVKTCIIVVFNYFNNPYMYLQSCSINQFMFYYSKHIGLVARMSVSGYRG